MGDPPSDAPESDTDTDGDTSAGRGGWPSWGDRVVVGLALLPFAVSAVALAIGADGFHPAGDLATSELAVRDIGRAPVLTGLYSRADWSHPGPLLWYLLWPGYRLAGSTGLGLALGALAINAAAVAGIAAVARRRGGTPLLVCALLGGALLIRSLGAGYTASFWNLHITTLPFALLVVLVWAMACGDRWALPAAAFVATFLAQTHVGFVPVALGLLAFGGVALVATGARAGRSDGGPGLRRAAARAARRLAAPAGVTVALLALLWLPPVLDVLTNEPSNAGRTLAWFRAAEEGVHSLGDGWRIVSAQFGLRPDWLVGHNDALSFFGGSPYLDAAPAPVLLVVAAAAAVALWRWRPRSGRRLVLTLGAALAISVVAVARTIGPMYDYRLRWTLATPALVFVAALWAGWLAVARRWPATARRVVLPALVAALVAVTAVDTVAAARATRIEPGDSAIMGALIPDVVGELERSAVGPGDEVLIADMPGAPTWFPGGLLVALDRRGYDARALPDRRDQLGERWVTSGAPDVELVVAAERVALDLVRQRPDDVVAAWSTVPMDDEGLAVLERTFDRADALSASAIDGEIDADGYLAGMRELERTVPTHGGMDTRLVVVVRVR